MIHPPRQQPPTWENGGYSISSHRVWLPGLYDSERAARYAFRFPAAILARIEEVVFAEKRLITFADLQSARRSFPARGQVES